MIDSLVIFCKVRHPLRAGRIRELWSGDAVQDLPSREASPAHAKSFRERVGVWRFAALMVNNSALLLVSTAPFLLRISSVMSSSSPRARDSSTRPVLITELIRSAAEKAPRRSARVLTSPCIYRKGSWSKKRSCLQKSNSPDWDKNTKHFACFCA